MATNRPPRSLKICKARERSHSSGAAATAADCKNGSVSDFCRFVLQHSVVVIHLAYMQWFTSESVVYYLLHCKYCVERAESLYAESTCCNIHSWQ